LFALWIALSSPLEPDGQSAEKRDRRRAPDVCASRHGQSCAMSDNNESKPAPALGPAVMREIGRELRAMYAEIIAEGVPERFAAILRKLDDPGNEEETR
jgi:hypothetical protein